MLEKKDVKKLQRYTIMDPVNAGVEKWTVDTTAMTCTYYDKSGKMMLEEEIPKI
jgi:uncharacterized protein YbcV (DUF1398 family)